MGSPCIDFLTHVITKEVFTLLASSISLPFLAWSRVILKFLLKVYDNVLLLQHGHNLNLHLFLPY